MSGHTTVTSSVCAPTVHSPRRRRHLMIGSGLDKRRAYLFVSVERRKKKIYLKTDNDHGVVFCEVVMIFYYYQYISTMLYTYIYRRNSNISNTTTVRKTKRTSEAMI